VGTVLALLIAGGALGMRAIPAAAVTLVVVVLAGRYFNRWIGGITGDCLGAANQVAEAAVYLSLAFDIEALG
jgi:adenosylcobinamide-GDP ribazoletransferase